jgi:spore coat polysaccharide biosynthesis protein SpsF
VTSGATVVVQARLGSSRLPGKVLADLAGRSLLAWVVRACRAATTVREVILTVPDDDERLVDEAQALDVPVVTGPEHDLLTRYQRAAATATTEAIVRITADCPLLDPAVVDACVTEHAAAPVDYQEARGYPRGVGDVDVMALDALLGADPSTATDWEREHVGPWFLHREDRYRIRMVDAPPELRRPDLRVCVDEDADLEVVRGLVALLGDRAPAAAEVIGALDAHPDLRRLNASVQQRS